MKLVDKLKRLDEIENERKILKQQIENDKEVAIKELKSRNILSLKTDDLIFELKEQNKFNKDNFNKDYNINLNNLNSELSQLNNNENIWVKKTELKLIDFKKEFPEIYKKYCEKQEYIKISYVEK